MRPNKYNFAGKKIWMSDEDADVRDSERAVLETCGAKVTVFESVFELAKAIGELGKDSPRPDAIIVDYNLNPVDATTQLQAAPVERTTKVAIEALKANPDRSVAQIPLIILSDNELVNYRSFAGVNARAYVKGSSLPQAVDQTLARGRFAS